ncbi:SET domain-containing protein [Candidatus Woesearchaeota archaeon]|nr:SET domain-containing protein [Candidatus Woesearchaeota archaeon]
MADVTVQNSKIEGKGVFAGRNFRKGETVMKWDTSIVFIKRDALKVLLNKRKYLVVSNGMYLLAQYPEKYLNHSCMPNTLEKNHYDIALRNIRKGEELTTDYSLDAPPHIKMKCACKNSNCKRII